MYVFTLPSFLFFLICGFSGFFSVYSVFQFIESPEMPINRGFQSDLTYTKRTVKRFVSPAPYCKWPQRPLFRVKKCKTTFHILYTNIQILFFEYRFEMYICIYRKRPKYR